MQEKEQPGTIKYLIRGVGYGLTSAFALTSGYLLEVGSPRFQDFLLLSTLLFVSYPFFVSYAICFHFQDPKQIQHIGTLGRAQKDALWLSGVFVAAPLSGLTVATFRILTGEFPSGFFFLSLALFGGLFLGYAVFLFRRYRTMDVPIMRHQLVWPVVLSVGFTLYFGLFLHEFHQTLTPIFPVIILVAYFLLSETLSLSKAQFILSSILLFFGLASSLAFGFIDSIYTSALLFCLSVAAYLAVFEAWRITAHVAQGESLALNSVLEQAVEDGSSTDSLSSRYYTATFLALTVSGLVVPLQYIFTGYGSVFLIGFALHSIAVYMFWYWAGGRSERLIRGDWVRHKIIFGFGFLSILVIDSRFSVLSQGRFMPNLVSFSGFSTLLVLTGFLWGKDIGEAMQQYVRSGFSRVFEKRERFPALASILSLLMCILVLVLQDLQDDSSLVVEKADRVFVLYSLYIVLSLIFVLGSHLDWWSTLRRRISPYLWGLVLTTRLFTASAIGLSVMLPALHFGTRLIDAFLLCLPFFLAAMAGFALNDFFDAEMDKIDKPHRAIPSGALSKKGVLILALTLLALAVWTVMLGPTGWGGKALQIGTVVGVVIYNKVKALGKAKTFYTAAICTTPFLFDLLTFEYADLYWMFPLAVFCFITGRELLMDVVDIRGDRLQGIITVPMIMGPKRTSVVGFALQLGACLLLAPIGLFGAGWLGGVLVTLLLGMVLALTISWFRLGQEVSHYLILLSWAPMTLAFTLLLL